MSYTRGLMFIAAGKVILDFYGNQSLKEKRKNMDALLEDVRRQFNVSATEVADFDDLERCVIGLALSSGTIKTAKAAIKKILEHIDQTAFARVVVEDTEFYQF